MNNKFYNLLFGKLPDGCFIELRFVAASWKDINPRAYSQFVTSKQEFSDALKNANEYYHVFVGVLPRRRTRGLTPLTKDDIVGGRVVWIDLDLKDTKDARQRLDSAPIPPNLIVNSGHGFHAYWLLDDYTETDEIEIINRGLITYFDADNCADCSRVLRVPSTLNIKRRAQPLEVFVEHYHKVPVTASVLKTVYPLPLAPSSLPFHTETQSGASFSFTVEDFAKKHGPLWMDYLKHGIAADINGYYDGDRSKLDFAIIKRMAASGFSLEAVRSIYTDPTLCATEKAREHRNPDYYIQHTYNKAKEVINDSV